MSGAALVIEGLTLSFKGIRALDGVSLEAKAGELVAVIGPNGAGKTSLFNCISGVYTPSAGSITLGGERLIGRPAHAMARLGVARMFQNLALFPQLTVLENLMLGRHHLYKTGVLAELFWTPGAKREEIRHRARVEELIDFLNLEAVRKTPVAILPYGILKRVELGRALAMEPRLLLLDEPAAGLNQEETEDLARYILDIKEELGVTQILIEHELGFVLDLAERIAVLDFGRRIAWGDPDTIAADPFVQEAYLGPEGALEEGP